MRRAELTGEKVAPRPHILVVVDPIAGDRQAAADKAAILARAFGASVELLYCDLAHREGNADLSNSSTAEPTPGAQPEGLLEKLAAPMRDQGIEVTIRVVIADSSLHESILDYLDRSNATLLVKDTHHHPRVRRTLLRNTDWYLAHGSAVPLLLTKSRVWGNPPKIMAAIDPQRDKAAVDALNRKILKCANGWAAALTGELHVTHAYVPVALAAAVSSGTMPETPEIARRLECESTYIQAQIEALTRACHVPSTDLHIEIGTPTNSLVDLVSNLGVDLVVIGASSHGRWHRMIIGSTASAILESLPCDLLVVRPD
jgi:universal stress protein E